LSSAGKGWRITVEQMVEDTGMSDKAVRVHLRKASGAGLLAVIRHHDDRGHRTATEYRPRFPAGFKLATHPADVFA
jgi:DNA-binding transcriptional regulator PaaX